MSTLTSSKARPRRSRLGAAFFAASVSAVMAMSATVPAMAFETPTPVADTGPGYMIHGVEGSGLAMWLGALSKPNDPSAAAWCIDAGLPFPTGAADSIDVLGEPTINYLPELTVTQAEMAWILANYEKVETADSRAAISILAHANWERGDVEAIEKMFPIAQTQHLNAWNTAMQYVTDARANTITDYDGGQHDGDLRRTGHINNVGVHNTSGEWRAGVDYTVTLTGPAVFDDNGNGRVDPGEDNVHEGTTIAGPTTLNWVANGTGDVTYKATFKGLIRKTLTKYGADGTVQDSISYGNRPLTDPEELSTPAQTWPVINDFQPVGTSNVADSKVVDGPDASVSDTFTAAADPNYGDGKWLEVNDKFVPVTYTWTAYDTGETPAATIDSVKDPTTGNWTLALPADAEPIDSGTVVANVTGATVTMTITLDLASILNLVIVLSVHARAGASKVEDAGTSLE